MSEQRTETEVKIPTIDDLIASAQARLAVLLAAEEPKDEWGKRERQREIASAKIELNNRQDVKETRERKRLEHEAQLKNDECYLRNEMARADELAHLKTYRNALLAEQLSHNEKIRTIVRDGFAAIAQALRELKS